MNNRVTRITVYIKLCDVYITVNLRQRAFTSASIISIDQETAAAADQLTNGI